MPAFKPASKSNPKTFTVDCGAPASDGIFKVELFEKFLHDRIKVNNKTGQLAGLVEITTSGNKVNVTTKTQFSKRYLKYLAKKFLRKNEIRDYIRVIASNSTTYELSYFKINEGDDEAAEEEEEQ